MLARLRLLADRWKSPVNNNSGRRIHQRTPVCQMLVYQAQSPPMSWSIYERTTWLQADAEVDEKKEGEKAPALHLVSCAILVMRSAYWTISMQVYIDRRRAECPAYIFKKFPLGRFAVFLLQPKRRTTSRYIYQGMANKQRRYASNTRWLAHHVANFLGSWEATTSAKAARAIRLISSI